jgi:hypothetical protein
MRFTLAIVFALGWSVEALAHQSTAYFSKNHNDVVKIEGRVMRFDWRSPHSELFVETKGPNGEMVVWRFDTTPAAWLAREGWTKDSLSAGDVVTVEGFPLVGQPYAWLGKVTKQDGTKLVPQRSTGTPSGWKP